MNIFGIGPIELLFIMLIIILLFSPKDIAGSAKKLGRGINRIYRSDSYQMIQKTSNELRNLPTQLAKEAGLDDIKDIEIQLHDEQPAVNNEIKSSPDDANQPNPTNTTLSGEATTHNPIPAIPSNSGSQENEPHDGTIS